MALTVGCKVKGNTSGFEYVVCELLGSGGQGEVYKVKVNDKEYALKWYYDTQASKEQRAAIEELVTKGAPSVDFLWPIEMACDEKSKSFGYIMPLREKNLKSIVDLMTRKAEPSFTALCTAAYNVVSNFAELHSKGMSYRDISFGNVFFNPKTGEVKICDNDNVTWDGSQFASVLGTPDFMAPEIVRGEAKPSTNTDLFSLSIMLFYMFMISHPLQGKKEAEIKCFDLPARNRLYGTEPIFIFDPNNATNRPVQGIHDNAIIYWDIYPQFIKDLFIRSFTNGIHDIENGRVRENEWKDNLIKLKDSLIYCPYCGVEMFYDAEILKQGENIKCWNDGKVAIIPPRIRINSNVIMLNHDTKLYMHHIDSTQRFNLKDEVAEISINPNNSKQWGFRNVSSSTWQCILANGSTKQVESGKTIALSVGLKINFGNATGEVRV